MVEKIVTGVVTIVVAGIACLGLVVATTKLLEADPKESVYACVAMDDSKYLAWERHLFNSSEILRARSTINGTWLDVAVPKITLSGCFTEAGLEMR